jgi:hypothetical protein
MKIYFGEKTANEEFSTAAPVKNTGEEGGGGRVSRLTAHLTSSSAGVLEMTYAGGEKGLGRSHFPTPIASTRSIGPGRCLGISLINESRVV